MSMEILPIIDDANTDFSLVETKAGRFGTKETPHCKKHGAMNKISAGGIWRCIGTHAIAKNGAQIDNMCRAGCKEKLI